MATKFAVEVTTTDVASGRQETTCSCSCGWSLTTTAASASMASQVAARARANHLQDAHPRQSRPSAPRPAVRRGPSQHTPIMGAAFKDGITWTRSLACRCGWERVASARTPFQADKALRSQHRRHVNEVTDRAPLRDYVLLLVLIAVVGALCLALADVAIRVSG